MKKFFTLSCTFLLFFAAANSFAQPRIRLRNIVKRIERNAEKIKRVRRRPVVKSPVKKTTKVSPITSSGTHTTTSTTHTSATMGSTHSAPHLESTRHSISAGSTSTGVSLTRRPQVSVSQEMTSRVDTELASVRGYTGRVYGKSRQLLLENEALFKTFQNVEPGERLRFLDILRKEDVGMEDVKALNYWYSRISKQLPKVESDLFQGLKDARTRGRLNDNTALFAKFKQAREADQVELLKYLEDASDNEVTALEQWCRKPQSRAAKNIDLEVVMFLKSDPAGAEILEALKEAKVIAEEEYQQVLAFEGDAQYVHIWMANNPSGMEVVRATQELFKNDSYFAELFFDSQAGKRILESASTFATDAMTEQKLPVDQMQKVFAEYSNLMDGGINKWYAPGEVASGFPRYHIVVEPRSGRLQVLTEREIKSNLDVIRVNASNLSELEELIFTEAFSIASGRVDDIVGFLREFDIKADHIESISLRVGYHEVGNSHIHTNIFLTDGRLFNYVQEVDFRNQGNIIADKLYELNDAFSRNIFSRPGKKIFNGKQDFEQAIKGRL